MQNSFRTGRVFVVLISAVGLLTTVACGDTATDGAGQDGPVVSEQGLYEAHITPEPAQPSTGENTLMIHLMDREGNNVEGADLGVEPWMPAHGHGSPETPVVEDLGDGIYEVDNLVYSMPGHWEVRIEIKNDGHSDRIVVDYNVE